MKGTGCPYCSGKLVLSGFNDFATLCPDLLKEWDYEKNKFVDPHKIGIGFSKKVWWFHKKALSLRRKYKRTSFMRKNLLTFSTAALLMIGAPAMAMAMPMVMEMGVAEQVEERMPTISVDDNIVSIQGASGMTLEVVSLTGRAVAQYKIESPAQRLELNLPKGCYILKVGKVVRKITVR